MSEKVHQNVLIVDRDDDSTRLILEVLAEAGIRGTVAAGCDAAGKLLGQTPWDLVILDAQAAGDAFAALERIKEDCPELPVVMIISEASVDLAVQAVRRGFRDVLPKPLDRGRLEELLAAALPNRPVALAAADGEDRRCLYQIAGRSRKLLEAMELASKAAPTTASLLITGESGTGKELIAYHVHRNSSRSRGPYVHVNCAALSESLLESELFGHERGAFTGAVSQRKGRFERAHGGTLLLDEISETTPRLQAELLRVLEQQDFERLGGSEPVRVNVRVVATSNRRLAEQVAAGRFREDLYYRIAGIMVTVPPLRERAEDIPELVWHFVNLHAREVRRRIDRLDDEMLGRFREYHWPGNVRQLRNVVRAALILGDGPTLSLEGVPSLVGQLDSPPPRTPPTGPLSLELLERQAIFEALRRTNSHQAKAARILGISDRTLREKLRRYRRQTQTQQAEEVAS